MKTNNLLAFSVLLALCTFTFTLSGCKKEEGCTNPVATNYNPDAEEDDGSCILPEEDEHIHMSLNFSHWVDGEAVTFDSIRYTNEAGNQYSVETLRYFISNVVLHSASGDVLVDGEWYVDAEDPSTLNQELGQDIEHGDYTGISFLFGLDSTKNMAGFFTNPPEVNMVWPLAMGPGYHYMKLEGKYDSVGVIKNYRTHTGQSMGTPYNVNVNLANSAFSAETSDLTVNIRMNVNNWYENPNQYDFNGFPTMIMGNQTAQTQLMQNGADVFSVSSIQ